MAKIDGVQEMAIAELVPYERNAKTHSAHQVELIARSITEFGFLSPCLIDKQKNIIAGHGRVLAAKKLGMKTVPCVFVEGLTDEQRRAYILADNRLTELGEWNMDLVNEELADLDAMDFDVSLTGFELELGESEIVEDDFDITPPEQAKTKRGDVYQLGRHRLMCGDSTLLADVQTLMNGAQADLYLTDPPYNVALGMGGSSNEARKRHLRTDGLVIMNDKMSDDAFRSFLCSAFSCAKQVMKKGAAFYIWHADNKGYNFRGAAIAAGFELRQTLVWVKNAMTLGRQDYQWRHEPCLYGWNDGAGHAWYSDRKQTTVLEFDRPQRSVEHPTMKPLALFSYQICNSTKADDIVYDGFGGSGTTLIACEQDGRVAYLMELDERYCDVIINRWETLTGEKAVKLNV